MLMLLAIPGGLFLPEKGASQEIDRLVQATQPVKTKQTRADYRRNPAYRELNNYLRTNSLDAIDNLNSARMRTTIDNLSSEERKSLYLSNHRPMSESWKPLILNILFGFGVGSYWQGNISGAILSSAMSIFSWASIILYPISPLFPENPSDKEEERLLQNVLFISLSVGFINKFYSSISCILYLRHYNYKLRDVFASVPGQLNFYVDSDAPIATPHGVFSESSSRKKAYRLMYSYRF